MSAGIRSALGLALHALSLAGIVLLVPACYQNRVTRIDPAQVTDLSGRWNDTDSRLVANKLIEQSLGGDWVRRYVDSHGGEAPTVIVGDISNRTMDHIPVGTFVKDLERAFVVSGAVRVVASADERQDVRAERQDQQQHARADSRARLAQEQGARYMLQGEVQAIEYGQSREKVVYYQVDATLIDLESNAKVWVGQEKIKKYIERRPLGL
ncbi:MAG TPA: penicillin-binding protein activator LpoB [Gemmatimonadaceae bacterium]|nr:penicillin-binding protein activator LpoB [Gemmatimonadaceae bacterium]